MEVSGPKGRPVAASFSCSVQRERRPHAQAARTLMDGLAFCRFPVPDVRRCYENIKGSRLTGRREMAARHMMDDHLLGSRCR